MKAQDLEARIDQFLKRLAIAIAVAMLLLLGLKLVGPSVEGTPPDPAILDISALTGSGSAAIDRQVATVDFVDRPLFRTDRRPPPERQSSSNETKAEAASAAQDETTESLEGVTATGVFSSGDMSGVFIKVEGGQRSRVRVGEDYEGWLLESVDAAGATFVAGARRARVDLLLNFNPALLAEPTTFLESNAPADAPTESAKSNSDMRSELADKGEDNAGAPRQALTFDSMMQERMRGRETQERERRE